MTPPKTPWQSRVGYYMIGIAVGLAILGAVNAIKKIQAARSAAEASGAGAGAGAGATSGK
jgi:hypothetical protein